MAYIQKKRKKDIINSYRKQKGECRRNLWKKCRSSKYQLKTTLHNVILKILRNEKAEGSIEQIKDVEAKVTRRYITITKKKLLNKVN